MNPRCFLTTLALLAGVSLGSPAAQPPNVIFILADDLGWSDTTLYGNTRYYQTPNVERLWVVGMASRGGLWHSMRRGSASPRTAA